MAFLTVGNHRLNEDLAGKALDCASHHGSNLDTQSLTSANPSSCTFPRLIRKCLPARSASLYPLETTPSSRIKPTRVANRPQLLRQRVLLIIAKSAEETTNFDDLIASGNYLHSDTDGSRIYNRIRVSEALPSSLWIGWSQMLCDQKLCKAESCKACSMLFYWPLG